MSAITDQQIADAQSYPPVDTTSWDPSLSWASQRIDGENADNAGCPPGYFTIYLPSAFGTFGAPYVRACRYIGTTTIQTLQQETAPGMVDQATINLADATKKIKEALTPSIPTWVWILGGFVAMTMVFPYRTGRAIRQTYEGVRSRNVPVWLLHASRHRLAGELTKGNHRNPGMTFKSAQRYLSGLGIALTKRDNEYRVNFKRGREATAYYTNDLEDAVQTGVTMSAHG